MATDGSVRMRKATLNPPEYRSYPVGSGEWLVVSCQLSVVRGLGVRIDVFGRDFLIGREFRVLL